jgi:pyruvate formate lyase activating enzyme
MKEAFFYERLEDDKVKCTLCNHFCTIAKGRRGICRVRENIDGKLYSLTYGKLVARHIDPIEKKPLFNFQPGSLSYSIATVGCNFKCGHCQNYNISNEYGDINALDIPEATPEEVVEDAIRSGCKSIAYTYTEPTIFFEFAYDTAVLAHKKGLKNVFVTNGFMSKEAIDKIAPYLDAANIDVKSYTEGFYKKVCKARLAPVLENVKYMRELGIWVEVTTLIIPTQNDDLENEIKPLAHTIMEMGEEIPWHLSAFHPDYKMRDLPRTSPETLRLARDIGRSERLRYVYMGNVYTPDGENTYCYECNALMIKREGYMISKNNIVDGKCARCGAVIDGVELS